MNLFPLGRPKPEEVFTPRRPLNEGMYVERRLLEERFERALRGNHHLAIFGDSGNGKTWLYQKVLKNHRYPYLLVDLAIAQSTGLDSSFRAALENPYGWQEEGKLESRSGGVDYGITAEKSRETQYTFADKPPFDKLVDELARKSSRSKFIVFDNLESVADEPDILRHISSYIIRLDNPRFVQSGVRFLFVGVVTDMKRLLSSSARAETVSNRIFELPEVKRLSEYEAQTIFRTGFFQKLNISFENGEEDALRTCVYYSGSVAQHIHEIGLNIAHEAEERNWVVDSGRVDKAINDWAESSLAGQSQLVRTRLNKIDTRVQRRNQVLYCIANLQVDEFTAAEVDRFVRIEFAHTAMAERLGIDQILKSLAQGDPALLVKDSSTNKFRLTHPKLRIVIRHVLKKSADGNIFENRR